MRQPAGENYKQQLFSGGDLRPTKRGVLCVPLAVSAAVKPDNHRNENLDLTNN